MLDRLPCDPLAVPDRLFNEMAVRECRRLHLHRGDDAGLALLHGLRDIGHVTLHLLAVLVAEAGFGVVGVLHAVRGYGLLVAQLHPTVLANDILLLEDTGEKPAGGKAIGKLLQERVDVFSDGLQTTLQCFDI